jgi:hypothetical protein
MAPATSWLLRHGVARRLLCFAGERPLTRRFAPTSPREVRGEVKQARHNGQFCPGLRLTMLAERPPASLIRAKQAHLRRLPGEASAARNDAPASRGARGSG